MRHGHKIEMLNEVMKKAIEWLKEWNHYRPNIEIYIRSITFSTGAEWVDKDIICLKDYAWKPLVAERGPSDLGAALSKVADALRFKKDGGMMPEIRSKRPHLVLITGGLPTDDWEAGLNKLNSTFWGEHAVRMAIATDDADIYVPRMFIDLNDAERRLCSLREIDAGFFTEGLIEYSWGGTAKITHPCIRMY